MPYSAHHVSRAIARFRLSANARTDAYQSEVDRVLRLGTEQAKPAFKDAESYARSIMSCSMLRLETHAAALIILILASCTSIFVPYGATDIFTRIGVIATAMAIGTWGSILLLYLLLPLHILYNFSLWLVAIIHSLAATAVFTLIAPLAIANFESFPMPTTANIFVPFLLLIGLADLFVLWQFKPQVCARAYRERHLANTIETILPAQKRGEVWVISAADHYVEFVTEKGRHMARMTMKVAVDKTAEADGLRVHRSHWVAYKAMLSIDKIGERHSLTLRNGDQIPVSAKSVEAVRCYLDSRQLSAAQ